MAQSGPPPPYDPLRLTELLSQFGVHLGPGLGSQVAPDPTGTARVVTELSHVLVGLTEAHAIHAEDAYRATGAAATDLDSATAHALRVTGYHTRADLLALANWRSMRLAGLLGGAPVLTGDQPGRPALSGTIALLAEALAGLIQAACACEDPEHGNPGMSGRLLHASLDAVQRAAGHIPRHRVTADLMIALD